MTHPLRVLIFLNTVLFPILAFASDGSGAGPVVAVMVGLVAAYFLPTAIAAGRSHRNAIAIFVMNLFTGWTGLGWVASLIWAFTDNRKEIAVGETGTCPECGKVVLLNSPTCRFCGCRLQ